MLQVVDSNAGGGALCFKWWGIMLQRWGIMLQVVDTNAGGGASSFVMDLQ